MDGLTTPALVTFVVGIIGLVASTAAMHRTIPERWTRPWRTRRPRALEVPARSRRVITGAPAAERILTQPRPAGQLAPLQDVLRQQRERRQASETHAVIDELIERNPQLLADVFDQWLAEDPDDPD